MSVCVCADPAHLPRISRFAGVADVKPAVRAATVAEKRAERDRLRAELAQVSSLAGDGYSALSAAFQ